MTRDMIKKKKQGFSFMLQKCKIWHFLKITVLTFFIISPVIFGLQRCTLSQIKALEILFWPCFIIFSPRINICWAIMSRSCQRFFYSPFSWDLATYFSYEMELGLVQNGKMFLFLSSTSLKESSIFEYLVDWVNLINRKGACKRNWN